MSNRSLPNAANEEPNVSLLAGVGLVKVVSSVALPPWAKADPGQNASAHNRVIRRSTPS
jgi:hypothetical protein